jgi:hypothetical protein
MKRSRLSALLLPLVIAALNPALVMQQQRAARREAELLDRMALSPQISIRNDDPKNLEAYLINGEVIKVGPQDGAARPPQVAETPGAKEQD